SYASFGAPGAMTFRGGDLQPLVYAGGPPEPPFSVDQVDEDFVTKCYEYKYAECRWPSWYGVSFPAFYPQYVPYGVFGPPPLLWWDINNNVKVCLLVSDEVAIFNEHSSLLYQFALPAPHLGGICWDRDNKRFKIRCRGQIELICDLSPVGYGSP